MAVRILRLQNVGIARSLPPSDESYYARMMRANTVAHRDWLAFNAGYSGVVYVPSTVAPCGFSPAGLPIGGQIVGPQHGDRACIQFARLLEREFQPFVPPRGCE